jgi:hypothetical protein
MKKFLPLLVLNIIVYTISAQSNFTSGSGELKGPGGYASQSIGQIAYTTYQSDSGKVNQGVIQPYQISVLSGEEVNNIQLSFKTFPNPVTNLLNLEIMNFENQELTYQLFDMNGRLLSSKKIQQSLTEISTADLPPATYFFKIIDQDTSLKIFKIVKTSF